MSIATVQVSIVNRDGKNFQSKPFLIRETGLNDVIEAVTRAICESGEVVEEDEKVFDGD